MWEGFLRLLSPGASFPHKPMRRITRTSSSPVHHVLRVQSHVVAAHGCLSVFAHVCECVRVCVLACVCVPLCAVVCVKRLSNYFMFDLSCTVSWFLCLLLVSGTALLLKLVRQDFDYWICRFLHILCAHGHSMQASLVRKAGTQRCWIQIFGFGSSAELARLLRLFFCQVVLSAVYSRGLAAWCKADCT